MFERLIIKNDGGGGDVRGCGNVVLLFPDTTIAASDGC